MNQQGTRKKTLSQIIGEEKNHSQGKLLSLSTYFHFHWNQTLLEKSRIRETPTLSTDADSRTDTNLKRLRDLS